MNSSNGKLLPVERFGRRLLARLQDRADRSRLGRFAFEFLMFGVKEAWACVFGGALVCLVLVTRFLWPEHAPIARYDVLVVGAVLIQATMLALRLEDLREAAAILMFHLVGTAMELFKTHVGSWAYPEAGVLRIGAVPLFSGFMYGSVGSYIARIWRIQHLRFESYPPAWWTWLLAIAIYLDFFTDHYGFDYRWALFGAAALVFRRTEVLFTPDRAVRRMPLLLAFGLIAIFIWLAENLATFGHAWIYPAQSASWRLVAPEKLGSWLLLSMISFVLVSLVRPPRPPP
jgi:uncharacterized membrane protein YoaT (DUF817 family)